MSDSKKIVVRKLEAAQRQLNCAIFLWFHGMDEVSIHTLAAAAYQITHDIKLHRGIDHDLLYDSHIVKDEYRGLWIRTMKEAQNFFKHADKDPDGAVELPVFGNLLFMMVAAGGLQLLGVIASYEVGALLLWLTINEPRLIRPEYLEKFKQRAQSIGVDDFEDVRSVGKVQFFEHYMRTSLANEAASHR
jgi:hypothetical protein